MSALTLVDFTSAHAPASRAVRKSVMLPHLAELAQLQDGGYSLGQMREYLAGNGVTVTRAAIHAFLLTNRKKQNEGLQKAG